MRKHGWIKTTNLKYEDNISNMDHAVEQLISVGFLETVINDLKSALNLLSKNDLKELTKEKNIDTSLPSPVSQIQTKISTKKLMSIDRKNWIMWMPYSTFHQATSAIL